MSRHRGRRSPAHYVGERAGGLTAEQRAAQVRASLEAYRRQLFQLKIDRSVAIGEPDSVKQLDAKIANLEAGIANLQRVFRAELARPAPQPEA